MRSSGKGGREVDHEKTAQGIRAEFGVPCVYLGLYAFGTHKLWNNYEGFYRWDAPPGVEGAAFRELRQRIERRLGELEAQADRPEGCPFALYETVIPRGECDSTHWGYIQRFVGSEFVLVCWPWRGMALLFREAMADLLSYREWQANPLAGLRRYWFLDETNQRRLRRACAQGDEEGARGEMSQPVELMEAQRPAPTALLTAADATAHQQSAPA